MNEVFSNGEGYRKLHHSGSRDTSVKFGFHFHGLQNLFIFVDENGIFWYEMFRPKNNYSLANETCVLPIFK